jgi:DNA-binding NarL/FixJ family response regulator
MSEQDARAGLTVVIADDQALVRAGFRMILDAETDIEVVGEVRRGRRRLPRSSGSALTSS